MLGLFPVSARLLLGQETPVRSRVHLLAAETWEQASGRFSSYGEQVRSEAGAPKSDEFHSGPPGFFALFSFVKQKLRTLRGSVYNPLPLGNFLGLLVFGGIPLLSISYSQNEVSKRNTCDLPSYQWA